MTSVRGAAPETAGGRVDLADRAVAGGRRRRAALVALTGLATLALTGWVIAANAGLLGREPPILTAAPSADLVPNSLAVAAYTPRAAGDGSWKLINPVTGRYRDVQGNVVAVSPDLRYAVVKARKIIGVSTSLTPEFSIYASTTGKTLLRLEFPVNTQPPLWSPDGRWLAFAHARNQNRADDVTQSVSLFDVITGKITAVDIKITDQYIAAGLLAWTNDSRGLIFAPGPSDAKPRGVFLLRMALDGALSPITTDWRARQEMTTFRGITLSSPVRAIFLEFGEPRTITVLDAQTGAIQSSYRPKDNLRPDEDGPWLTGEQRVFARGNQIHTVNVRTGARKAVLTLPSNASRFLLSPQPHDAKTPSLHTE